MLLIKYSNAVNLQSPWYVFDKRGDAYIQDGSVDDWVDKGKTIQEFQTLQEAQAAYPEAVLDESCHLAIANGAK